MQEGAKHLLTYFCFDLLHVDGRNVRDLPLRERKELLGDVLSGSDEDVVRVSEHIETVAVLSYCIKHVNCRLRASCRSGLRASIRQGAAATG